MWPACRTLTALGTRPPGGAAVSGISPAALETLRAQARLQLEQYRDGAIRFELIPLDAAGEGRGLASLPLPSPGDVFLDLEADIFVGEGGLEYLFGLLIVEDGRPVYREVWAHSLEDEKAAFCSFMDLVAERRRRWPEMHVYHYGGYESGALKRLMGRHAVREDDLDVLLRGRVLVDLYSVLRQGVRVSDESYSLKKIEKLYMPAREGPVTHPGFALVSYEEWLETRRPSILRDIAAYNRDDCLSVWKLRSWLEAPRRGGGFGGPAASPPGCRRMASASDSLAAASAETAPRIERLRGRRLAPEQRAQRGCFRRLLDFHRREDKPQWWRYFFLRERPMEELVAASDALGGLEWVGVVGSVKQSVVHRYRYDPEQEHPFKAGDPTVDPSDEGNAGTVVDVDRAAGTIDLKRGAPARGRTLGR